jgi:ketosteroid isomerase-like protein
VSAADVARVLDAIHRAWTEGRASDLVESFDENIVMVLPGFDGRIEGRDALIAGFEDFCRNARLLGFEESDRQVDVRDSTAVASFAYVVRYERDGKGYRATGRDLWIFHRFDDGRWRAVWRTMLDVEEEPLE